jgi:hypothetical protein
MCTCTRPEDATIEYPSLIAPTTVAPTVPPSPAVAVAMTGTSSCAPTSTSATMAAAPKKASEEPGRNDLCPCGSKLRYRKCCAKRKKTAARIAAGGSAHLSNKQRRQLAKAVSGAVSDRGNPLPDDSDDSDEDVRAAVSTLLIYGWLQPERMDNRTPPKGAVGWTSRSPCQQRRCQPCTVAAGLAFS